MKDYTPGFIYVSPSQVKSYRECGRKIAFRYNEKLKDAGSPKAWFGKAVHKEVEKYLVTGQVPDNDSLNMPALGARTLIGPGYLPTPSSRVVAEGEFNMTCEIPGVMLSGQIDIMQLLEDGMPEVDDVKTTGHKSYALTPATFDDDPQVLIYSKYIAQRFGGGWAKAKWLYLIVKWSKNEKGIPIVTGFQKKPHVVENIFNIESRGFKERWATLMQDVAAIADIRRSGVMGNALMNLDTSSCSNFNGCPHQSVCTRTAGMRIVGRLTKMWRATNRVSAKGEEEVDFKARLAAMRGAAATEETPKETPAATPQKEATAKKPEAATAVAGAGAALADLRNRAAAAVKANPPASSSQTPRVTAETLERNKDLLAPEEHAKEKAELETKAAPADEPKEAPAKKPRAAKATKADAVVAAPADGLVVMFDVVVTKGTPTGVTLHEVIAPLLADINEQNDVMHYTHIDFGKGRGILVKLLDDYLAEGGFKGTILADSTSPETIAVKDILFKHATSVVQGI